MRRHRIPLYGGSLVVCGSLDEFNGVHDRLVKQLGMRPTTDEWVPGAGATSGFSCTDGVAVVTYLDDKRSACHEATHCAQDIADHIGMDPLREKEAFAYLTQWCFDRITGVRA